MSRIRNVLVLTGILTLALAGAALATKVTGGSAQVTVFSTTAGLLSSNGITATAIGPATQSGTTFTFPVRHGRFDAKTGHARVLTGGGIQLSNGSSTVRIRRLQLVADRRGVSVRAFVASRRHSCHVRGHRHPHSVCTRHERFGVVRIATLSGATISGSSASGTLDITKATADLINRLAGKTVASAGEELGTVSASLTSA